MTLNRRNLLKISGAGALTLGAPTVLRAAGGGTVRIGLITTLSGPGQLYGDFIKTGCEIAVDRINAAGGVNGKMIELVVRDDRNSPEAALTAFRELSGAGIKLFAQGTFTSLVLATLPHLETADVTMVVIGTSSLAVTHESYSPRAFRIGYSSPMCFGGYGHLMADRYPEYDRWAVAQTDIQALKDITAAFADRLTKTAASQGREILFEKPQLFPYGGANFRSQISNLMGSKAKATFNCLQGADAISFYKQARSFGFEKKFSRICDSGNELSIAKAMGRKTPENLWSWTAWYPQGSTDNEMSNAVHAAYKARTQDEYPNWYVGVSHDAITTLARAVETTQSESATDLVPALEAISYQGAIGNIAFRKEDHSFAGDLLYINFGRDTDSEQGWSVFETAKLNGVDFLEPASPGRKLDL